MFRIEEIKQSQLGEIEAFIPEDWKKLVEKYDSEKDIVWKAVKGEKTCGMLWGHHAVYNNENCFYVVWLEVLSELRKRGIGTMLLQKAEEEAKRQKVDAIRINIKENEFFPAALKMLGNRGWGKPEPVTHYCESTVDKFFSLSWTDSARYAPYDGHIHPWTEPTPEELELIRKTEGGYFAGNEESELLWDKEKVETMNSFLLRDGEKLIGWLITHRHKPDAVHYTSIFILDDHRGSALYRAVIVKALGLQKAAGIQKWSWAVLPENKKSQKLWSMLFNPVLVKKETWHQARKTL